MLALAAMLACAWLALAAEPPHSDALTRHDYVLHCAGCHKFDGTGSARIPNLHGIGELVGRPGWRTYLMRVPGVAQAPLSDERLALLLDWVVGRFGGAAPAPAFAAADVGRQRTRPLRDPIRARAELLRAGTATSP